MSRLTNFPIIKPFVRSINGDVEKYGLQKAMMNTVIRSGSKLEIKGMTAETESVLKQKPVVLVANHPHEVDIIALLASVPERQDTSLIISSRFINLAPNADKYLIPVYIEHHTEGGIELKGELLKKFHPTPTYTPEEEHEKNIKSIALASKKLRKGEMVIIFPNPNPANSKRWYSGVGHLLKGARAPKKIYVVKAFIQGTSNLDYLRLLPHAAKLLTPISVTFSKPQIVNNIIDNDPKKIASVLEQDYLKWSENLKT